jgi:CRP-like cAMP-binding protein
MERRAAIEKTGNLFLDNLPERAMQAIAPSLTRVSLKHGEVIYQRDAPFDRILFPFGSIISIVLEMSDGDTAEVGIIGREGMSGFVIALGQSASNQRAIVQVPNSAGSVAVAAFRAAMEEEPELKAFSLRYAQAVMMMGAQLSACNSLHTINERCARWLLMAHDRVPNDLILLTQEFLSQMLGVRRTGVTLAASTLQEAGFISYSRGHITVRSRAGLESATCECYESIEGDWKRLMGYGVRKESQRFRAASAQTVPSDGAGSKNG